MLDRTTVKDVDLERFQGTWYEIARYPNKFEKNMVGVTATYTLRDNGKIRVLNQGYLDSLDGRHKKINGKARVPDPSEPGRLQVSFFLFFYSDYLILELDTEEYQWALIGSSSPDYLWVLSRKPVMPEKIYDQILDKARNRGYELDKLLKVLQREDS
jgi:lipocalin